MFFVNIYFLYVFIKTKLIILHEKEMINNENAAKIKIATLFGT
jgi:hypothetical protein